MGSGARHLVFADGRINGYACAIFIACIIDEIALVVFLGQTVIRRFANVLASPIFATIWFTSYVFVARYRRHHDIVLESVGVSASGLSGNALLIAAHVASKTLLELVAFDSTR